MTEQSAAKEGIAPTDQPIGSKVVEQVSEAKSPATRSEGKSEEISGDDATSPKDESKEDGELDQDEDDEEDSQNETARQQADFKWCKIFYEPTDPTMQNYYYMHFDTRETGYEEPTEPYWIWDALTNNVHASGLQQPSMTATSGPTSATPAARPSEPVQEYQGYNPAIHGSYDPNAPYAQFHNSKRAEEDGVQTSTSLATAQTGTDYTAVGTFNRFTGGFQSADKSAERHDDYNKSGRQMNAFFDVDAAANSHEGRSLKEERRQNKLSQKEIRELSKKRREKKEKKRLDFYKS
ncbi:hypothetical protein LTR78_000178 [Recurvomyces mirabilis]|uniref:WW domain-containing protein n=1 Tax=Recurvomyces mirabilis TaxID=574656 RepID=A0AAE1C6A9_9PEZI|nr:hypothetical protein LTR78_000178 [Recurvomyces mirabilis]KAK5161835.1 hypothetical protein LTS14_000180 [Recurvomyces mirabilis]